MIIKQSQVRIGDGQSCPEERRVELLREDGIVRALEVRCSCGSVTVVELDYEAPASPAPPES